jgi:hypothetical protein
MGGTEVGWSRHNDEGTFRDYQKEAERLAESGKKFGLIPIIYDNDFIKNLSYYKDHLKVLERTSFGFAYKAICIYETMKIMSTGDILIWSDSNHVVDKDPQPFIDIALEEGIFCRDHIWTYYPQIEWTRKDTFVNMNCDEEKYWRHPQLQDSIIVFMKCKKIEQFVEEWKDFSLDYDVMFGNNVYPNAPTLKEHRHNQSIFTNLVCKYEFPFMNRTNNVWGEFIIPEIETITPENPVDNSYRKEQDRKDIR